MQQQVWNRDGGQADEQCLKGVGHGADRACPERLPNKPPRSDHARHSHHRQGQDRSDKLGGCQPLLESQTGQAENGMPKAEIGGERNQNWGNCSDSEEDGIEKNSDEPRIS